jgi:hypothetical protein
MLKVVQEKNGFSHSLLQADGVLKAVESAKKQEDWLVFNLYRRDSAAVAEVLFGKNEQNRWLLEGSRGEVYELEKSNNGYLSVGLVAQDDGMDEDVPENKLRVAGYRFMEAFSTMARELESTHPKLFAALESYPSDIYRRGNKTISVDVDEGVAEDEEIVAAVEPIRRPGLK